MADLELVALTRERATRLTGLTARQLDYWDATGLVKPSVEERLTPHRRIRLYEYTDLMSLLVIAQLRSRRVSLQHVRRIVSDLRQRGYPEPLTQVRYATHGSQVYVQPGDGEWESSEIAGQAVIHQVLDLTPLRARLRAASERDPQTFGKIDRRRGALGSKPLIAGTRLPVETVKRYLQRGATTDEVLAAYPVLVHADVQSVRRELAVA